MKKILFVAALGSAGLVSAKDNSSELHKDTNACSFILTAEKLV